MQTSSSFKLPVRRRGEARKRCGKKRHKKKSTTYQLLIWFDSISHFHAFESVSSLTWLRCAPRTAGRALDSVARSSCPGWTSWSWKMLARWGLSTHYALTRSSQGRCTAAAAAAAVRPSSNRDRWGHRDAVAVAAAIDRSGRQWNENRSEEVVVIKSKYNSFWIAAGFSLHSLPSCQAGMQAGI